MKPIIIQIIKYKSLIEIGEFLFLCGVFFLVSAPSISLIFLFPSLLIGSYKRKDKYFEDKWNYPLFLVSILMTLSCLINNQQLINLGYNNNFSFIGLLNWIPLFWTFWGIQPYLVKPERRKRCLLIILAGSFPLLITCLGQYFLKWYGPFEFLNGFIIWFQRPIDNSSEGLTGLFNNQNYAGTWLSMIFYIGLAFSISLKEKKNNSLFGYFLTILIGLVNFLTYSRNALLSVFLGFFVFFKTKKSSLNSGAS